MPTDNADGRGEVAVGPKDLFNDEFSTEVLAQTADDQTDDTADDGNDNEPAPKGSDNAASGKVTRTVDLGDGSGTQVFSADTADELLDILTTAQFNATKKIREQQFELKKAERAKPERSSTVASHEPKQLTADELFAIANEIQRNPDAAFDKILKAKTNMTGEELGKFVNDIKQERAVAAADVTFLQNHQEDWVPSVPNAARMQKFLTDEKLPYTAANLEYAFQELKEGGLLDLSSEANPAGDGKVKVQPHERRKPMSTGLRNSQSSARTAPTDEKPGAITESEVEQLYKLPQDEARVFMQKIMRRAASSKR